MPAAKSSTQDRSGGANGSTAKSRRQVGSQRATTSKPPAWTRRSGSDDAGADHDSRDGAGPADELAGLLSRPLDLVLLTRERIQATLDEAAERGRVTRSDANDLVAELLKRGRQGTDDLLDRARRSVGAGPSLPIAGYDELTVGQVTERLPPLGPAELRRVRDYERRHANRKSVLAKIEKLLG